MVLLRRLLHRLLNDAGPQYAPGGGAGVGGGGRVAGAAGGAPGRAGRRRAAADPRGRLAFAGGAVDGITLVAAAANGDTAASEAIEAVAAALGRGLASLVAILDPDVIVVAGGVGAIGDPILEPARRAMMAATSGRSHRRETPVVAARFGADAGLVGAAVAAGGDA